MTVRLTDDEYADLDARASTAGQDRSTYLRECAARVKKAEERRAARLKGAEVDS